MCNENKYIRRLRSSPSPTILVPSLTSSDVSSCDTTNQTQPIPQTNSNPPTSIPSPAADHNIPIGDPIQDKNPKHIRVVLQNPNGLSAEDNLYEYLSCLYAMHTACADVILLPETNLHWSNYAVQQATYQHRMQLFHHSKQQTSCSSRVYDNAYQPGGTCSIVTNHTSGRFHSSTNDTNLGRWSITHLNISNSKILTIICAYQVCKQMLSNVGSKTAYAQQWSLLRESGIECPDPRKQFVNDLSKTIDKFKLQGHSIILAGDFNESITGSNTASPQGLESIILRHNLRDAVDHLHGKQNCPTYFRGKERLDYVFVSSDILPSIMQSGICPFDAIISSDHRAIFADIDVSKISSESTPSLMSIPTRRLFSHHEDKRKDYIKILHEKLERHNVFERSEELESFHEASEKSNALVEAIDRDMTRLAIHAEKTIKKCSKYPFSTTLAKACTKVSILKSRMKEMKYGVNRQHSISILQSRLDSPLTLPETIPETKRLLKLQRKEVRSLRRDAEKHRHEYLAKAISESPSPKIIRHIQRTERLNKAFNKIRHFVKPSTRSQITHLEVPDDGLPPKQCKRWRRITNSDEITARLIERNTKHFQGAQNTPFTIPPLSDQFDWQATSAFHQQTLEGFPPTHPDSLVQRLLNLSKQRIPSFDSTITMEELIRRIRKWKEMKSTSPSGKHLGHYRSLLQHPEEKDDDYDTSKKKSILRVILRILNYCARTGYTLERWTHIVTTMIPKEEGNLKIHRLRVIHLYEADLTMLFGIWAKKLVRGCEKNKTLNPGSFGARPGRSSTDPPFIQLMQIEISHLS